MSISQYSARSGVPVSTIKFYIRQGLLQPPIKTAATRGYYTRQHLERLRLIRRLRRDGNMPLRRIREITKMLDASQRSAVRGRGGKRLAQRARIVEAAISLFRKKGYEAVTISDIVRAAGIGRSTFYRNFDEKKDLFIGCIREIIHAEGVPAGGWGTAPENGASLFERSAEAYFRESPLWRDMVQVLRAAAINDPAEFRDTLEEAIQLKIEMFRKRITDSVRKGFMREVNATILAVMLVGIQDACLEYLSKGGFKETPEEVFEAVKDILLHGVRRKE